MDMNINEALNICKRLKNHYRAFEKIDELLKEGVAIQIFMKEVGAQKASLEQEIATLTQERDEASESCIAMEKERKEAQRNLDEITPKLAQIKASLAEVKTKVMEPLS